MGAQCLLTRKVGLWAERLLAPVIQTSNKSSPCVPSAEKAKSVQNVQHCQSIRIVTQGCLASVNATDRSPFSFALFSAAPSMGSFFTKLICLLLRLSNCRNGCMATPQKGGMQLAQDHVHQSCCWYTSPLFQQINDMLIACTDTRSGWAIPPAQGEHRGLFRLVLSLQCWLFLLSFSAPWFNDGVIASLATHSADPAVLCQQAAPPRKGK